MRLAFYFMIAFSSCFRGGFIAAQEKKSAEQIEAAKRKDLDKIAESVEFLFADGQTGSLVKSPIFSWSNPERQSDGGLLYMWTKSGRPVATLGIWRVNEPTKKSGYEYQSLTPELFEAKSSKLGNWSPEAGGVEFGRLTEVAAPLADNRRRQNQMRQIARDHFSAEIDPGTPNSEQLRVLPTPVFLYDEKPKDVIDGAVFSFASGTDPEVLLILEARKISNDEGWFYAMARSTSHAVSGRCNGVEVLSRVRLFPSSFHPSFKLEFWNESVLKD